MMVRAEKWEEFGEGPAERNAGMTPSRAVHGWTEGVETRRGGGIASRNTPKESHPLSSRKDIVQTGWL